MKPRAVLFDLYRTLVDITTDEGRPEVWERLAAFLRYRGLPAEAARLQRDYFAAAERVQADSREQHPEVNVLEIFAGLLGGLGHRGRGRGPSRFCVEVVQLFRVLSTVHIGLYPDTLRSLRALRERRLRLALVSDAQRWFLLPEIRMLGLAPLFGRRVVISSDCGFHKPDPRMFERALTSLGLKPDEAIYVGDNVKRDIRGAREAGLYTVLIRRRKRAKRTSAPYRPDSTFGTLDEFCAWLLD